MITKETSMCFCNGTTREKATYYGLEKDVVQNGDGTYSIPGVTGYNADTFMAMDNTDLILMCNGETGKWHLL